MRKVIWTCIGLLSLVLVASHLRSASFDCQLTGSIWWQATTQEGRLRIVALRGDPTASWTANTVIERDKATWRRGLSTSSFGLKVFHATADTLGTPVDTYRLDLPLLLPLLLVPGVALFVLGWRRWGAPPGMIWRECWTRSSRRHQLIGALRITAIVTLGLVALGTFSLWIGGHLGLPARWSYLGDRFAFVTTGPNVAYGFQVPAGDKSLVERIDEMVEVETSRLIDTPYCLAIDVMDGRIGVRYFRGGRARGTPKTRYQYTGAGFEIREELIPAPLHKLSFPSAFYTRTGLSLGVERAITMPSWAWLVLFGFWPFLRFVRGPLRRARHRATGCCRRCGYNLTGLTFPRCPECGQMFDSKSVTTATPHEFAAIPDVAQGAP